MGQSWCEKNGNICSKDTTTKRKQQCAPTHAKIQRTTTYARCVQKRASRRCLLAVSCLFVSVSLEPSFGMKFRPAFKTVTEKTTKGKQSLRQERFSMFSLHALFIRQLAFIIHFFQTFHFASIIGLSSAFTFNSLHKKSFPSLIIKF